MAMETLSPSNLPAGRPVAVFAGGKIQAFAIGAGGMMYRWTSVDGLDWQGPNELLRNGTNLEPSYPCAIAVGNAVHVFAIGHGGPFASGGPLVRWSSADGTHFMAPVQDNPPGWAIPGGTNGLAACAPNANSINVFAVTPAGLGRYWYSGSGALGWQGIHPLPAGPLPRCVPAAVSASPNVTDVFAVGSDGNALRWHNPGGFAWLPFTLPRPAGASVVPLVRSGFAAVSPALGQIELFAVTPSGLLAHWSLDGLNVTAADFLPGPSLNDSVPAAIVVDDRIEVFAIGPRPNDFSGGVLVRWRRDRGRWSDAKVIGANLSAGGLGAAAATGGRIDTFGLGAGGLHHWPAGIRAAGTEPWANWANNLQMNPDGHCHPSTEEEVVAIVKSAGRVSGARVRAVGSSWSFTDITVPPAPGFIVETNEMNSLVTNIIDAAVLTDHWKSHAGHLVHVEAGIQVEALMRKLDAMGLAPFTMGGSSGQTLGGVISTGVHGSDWDRGPIPNAVRAIQLVAPGGTQYWLEPDQWRITDETELRKRLGPGVTIRYDDDWFDSVLVSMGSMGIITSVVLEVTNQYFRQTSCEEKMWSALRAELASGVIFADPDHYVMAAIDPFLPGDRTCFVVKQRWSPGPRNNPPGSFDALAFYCQLDANQALASLAALAVTAPLMEALLSAVTATAGVFGIPLPAGTTLAVATPLIVAGLKLAGPGAVGDFLARVFDSLPNGAEHLAAFASARTRDALKPTQSSTDLAHSIMAPPAPGECAARGLAVEMAFDATTGAYLTFVDEAIKLLDRRRTEGLVLGGWFSLRFTGPSRAILSPQQSARTCMIEVVAVRSLISTVQLLDELEKLSKAHGAIQHWGMHRKENLAAADLPRAYPRLDTWRRVRREVSGNATFRTFENDLTARLGLDAPPAGTPLVRQDGWRWCNKCLGMVFGGNSPGPCPAGGTHDYTGSGNYAFAHNAPWVPGQRGWRWCRKCTGMVHEDTAASLVFSPAASCSAGGAHDLSASGAYTIPREGQSGWHFCAKCQSLDFFGAGPAPCPAGGGHHRPFGSYWLAIAPREAPSAAPAPGAPDIVPIIVPVPGMPGLTDQRTELAHSLPEVPGERGWRRCTKCQGLTRAGGKCADSGTHAHDGSLSFVIPLNAPTAPGQAHWRLCRKCQTMGFRQGPCFAGGDHDFTDSGDYTLRGTGQHSWRHCRDCGGLWFSGNGGQGKCPSPAGVHDLGFDDYLTGGLDWTG